ncbi:rCG21860 [Rattus norvegicus]|uniref:RCG21860 n=1 Tax=Rattus norvegicus TaxID=10116 RepID=A6J159_RAT|nr:rCG21860 [Rattus norvegicus]
MCETPRWPATMAATRRAKDWLDVVADISDLSS